MPLPGAMCFDEGICSAVAVAKNMRMNAATPLPPPKPLIENEASPPPSLLHIQKLNDRERSHSLLLRRPLPLVALPIQSSSGRSQDEKNVNSSSTRSSSFSLSSASSSVTTIVGTTDESQDQDHLDRSTFNKPLKRPSEWTQLGFGMYEPYLIKMDERYNYEMHNENLFTQIRKSIHAKEYGEDMSIPVNKTVLLSKPDRRLGLRRRTYPKKKNVEESSVQQGFNAGSNYNGSKTIVANVNVSPVNWNVRIKRPNDTHFSNVNGTGRIISFQVHRQLENNYLRALKARKICNMSKSKMPSISEEENLVCNENIANITSSTSSNQLDSQKKDKQGVCQIKKRKIQSNVPVKVKLNGKVVTPLQIIDNGSQVSSGTGIRGKGRRDLSSRMKVAARSSQRIGRKAH